MCSLNENEIAFLRSAVANVRLETYELPNELLTELFWGDGVAIKERREAIGPYSYRNGSKGSLVRKE